MKYATFYDGSFVFPIVYILKALTNVVVIYWGFYTKMTPIRGGDILIQIDVTVSFTTIDIYISIVRFITHQGQRSFLEIVSANHELTAKHWSLSK